MQTKEFKISGLSCQHCVSRVKKALESMEVIHTANVQLDNNSVILQADKLPELEELNLFLKDYGEYKLI